jgi:putative lipoic acid-binding regulatory protein
MGNMPSVELLESTHRFPGPYVFKVIGKAEDAFVARVVAAVREVLGGEADPPFETRHTSGGRHVSVTVRPHVHGAMQVLAIYSRLQTTAGLVMLM